MRAKFMQLTDVLAQLTDWFPVEDHKERTIKGGSKWYYIPHQAIRDRLNEICPGEWSTEYEGPHLIDGEPIYHCRLTICGITRTGIGDKSNEPSPYGTSAQRAFRKAFVDAAEQFGIGAYLDEQTSEKTKRSFIRHMQQSGNGKAAVFYQEARREADPAKASLGSRDLISDAQRKRLYAIAIQEGRYTDIGFRRLVESQGFASSKDITKTVYDTLCDRAKDPVLAVTYNQEAVASAS